jgi:hypothetical protein
VAWIWAALLRLSVTDQPILPSFLSDSRKPLHLAIANLCLKAWRAREKAQAENPDALSWLETPEFIQQLRTQRAAKEAKIAETKGSKTSHLNLIPQAADMKLTPPQSQSQTPSTLNSQPMSAGGPQLHQSGSNHNVFDPMFSPDDFAVMDDMPMDWQRWDTLLNDFEMPVQPLAAPGMPAQLQFSGQYGQQGYSWPLPSYQVQ